MVYTYDVYIYIAYLVHRPTPPPPHSPPSTTFSCVTPVTPDNTPRSTVPCHLTYPTHHPITHVTPGVTFPHTFIITRHFYRGQTTFHTHRPGLGTLWSVITNTSSYYYRFMQ